MSLPMASISYASHLCPICPTSSRETIVFRVSQEWTVKTRAECPLNGIDKVPDRNRATLTIRNGVICLVRAVVTN